MKKLIFLLFLFWLASCFGPSKEAQVAKENLLNNSGNEVISENVEKEESSSPTLSEKVENYSRVQNLTGALLIDILPVDAFLPNQESFDLNGKVLSKDVTKITVSFENPTSKFPKDENYILQTFKQWQETFLYRAYKKYEVLDEWQNLYRIDAYIGDEVQQSILLEIFLAPKSQIIPPKEIQMDTQSHESGKMNFSELNQTQVTCENISETLTQKYSWFYWNSCRPIIKDESFWVFVLRLEWETYLYEKHYFDTIQWISAVVVLETGTGITREQLPEQNQIFKEKIFPEVAGFDEEFKNYNKN